MKKIIDLAQIEAREKKLEDELAELRTLKKYVTKFGADYGIPQRRPESNQAETAIVAPQADVEEAARYVISKFGKADFNYPIIEQSLVGLDKKYSRSSVFDVISALKENGEIEVVLEGAGRRPAMYRVTDKFQAPQIN
jgi:hypothetical protein